jgi:hypothetical protein
MSLLELPWARSPAQVEDPQPVLPCRLSIVAPDVSVKRRISESGVREEPGDHPVDQAQTRCGSFVAYSEIGGPRFQFPAGFVPQLANGR